MTTTSMPRRSDMNSVINKQNKEEGRIGTQNSRIIDILKPSDVLAVDQSNSTCFQGNQGHEMGCQGEYTQGEIERDYTRKTAERFNAWAARSTWSAVRPCQTFFLKELQEVSWQFLPTK